MRERLQAGFGPSNQMHAFRGGGEDQQAASPAVRPVTGETRVVGAGRRVLVALAVAVTVAGSVLVTGLFAHWLSRASGWQLAIGSLGPAALGFLITAGLAMKLHRGARRIHYHRGSGGQQADLPRPPRMPDPGGWTADWDGELADLVEAQGRAAGRRSPSRPPRTAPGGAA